MRVHVVDPSAYTPPYDHALCVALSRAGADVELVTSSFAYGGVPNPDGYRRRELFYRRASGPAGSRLRLGTKLVEHVPDMLRYRRLAASADVIHFQWLPVQWIDRHLLPKRPTVLTAHDLLPREARAMQARAQRRLYEAVDAVVVHSAYGRGLLVDELGIDRAKVHVVPHGAFEHLTRLDGHLPAELGEPDRPVVLFFGLLRPYKGIDALLSAWRASDLGERGELWVVGRPRLSLESLREQAPAGVRFVPRFVSDGELAASFRRADVVVLPYLRTERLDFSGVLATALAFGKAIVVTDVGSFREVAAGGAARLVPPNDPATLAGALQELIDHPAERERLEATAREAATGRYSWTEAARRSLALYGELSMPESAPS